MQIGPRWGWLPGPIAVAPIYGPAFVAFVGGPGFAVGFGVGSVAAWFPLGPGEPFYPWYHHSNVYLQQVNITNVRNINITNITNVTNVNNIHYRYQTVATTAVNANAFRGSEPVARNMVLARAQVIPHPEINPTPRAIAAGGSPARPPVRAERPVIVQHAPVVNRPGQPATAVRNIPPGTARPNETVRPNENIAHTPAPNPGNVPQPPNRNNPEVRGANTPPPSTGSERTAPANVPHTPPPAYQPKGTAAVRHPIRRWWPEPRRRRKNCLMRRKHPLWSSIPAVRWSRSRERTSMPASQPGR